MTDEPTTAEAPVAKKRGRPPGSKNKAPLPGRQAAIESNLATISGELQVFSARLTALESSLWQAQRAVADEIRAISESFTKLLQVMRYFQGGREEIAQQLRDMDNDIQDILEATARPKASQEPPQSIGVPIPSQPTRQPSGTAPAAGQPPKTSLPFDGDMGLRTVGPQTPVKPAPKVEVPRVPEATMKMQFLGDQGAFAEAMVFQDNPM